jgi:hypothetical protein
MPAPIVPLLPALLALTTTVIGIATQKTPKVPQIQRLDPDNIDDELRDAQKRKGRQIFAGDRALLEGGQIGAERTLGIPPTIIGGET